MASAFERLVGRLPYDVDKILGSGISFFIREQEPENVEFNVRVNSNDEVIGWEIKVDTDEMNTEQAKEFWEERVNGRL